MFDDLTDMVLKYQEGHISLEKVRRTISLRIYELPLSRFFFSEDERSEFFLYFYPRIPIIVGRFKPEGKKFIHYLLTWIRWQIQSYRRDAFKKDHCVKLSEQVHYFDYDEEALSKSTEVHEKDNFTEIQILPAPKQRNSTYLRRLLFLTVKASNEVDENMIRKVAAKTLTDENLIHTWVETARAMLLEKRQKQEKLKERLSENYIKYRFAHEVLEIPSIGNKNRWNRKMTFNRDAWLRLSSTLKKKPLLLTNAEVAEVMGIRKGTVDSGIQALKTQFIDILKN